MRETLPVQPTHRASRRPLDKTFHLLLWQAASAEFGDEGEGGSLTSLAIEGGVFASTQGQALAALLFPYKQLQEIELSWLDDVVRAKRSQCVPTVFAASEVARALPMPVSTASWRHTIATHWLASGQDIRTAQAFLWHSDVNTILVYAHAVNRGPMAVLSPLDRLPRRGRSEVRSRPPLSDWRDVSARPTWRTFGASAG